MSRVSKFVVVIEKGFRGIPKPRREAKSSRYLFIQKPVPSRYQYLIKTGGTGTFGGYSRINCSVLKKNTEGVRVRVVAI